MERLDLIAARYYGEPSLWRVLAAFNGITDPTRIPPPRTIRIPPLSALRAL
jgi:nucleoid-associated protein YgaU